MTAAQTKEHEEKHTGQGRRYEKYFEAMVKRKRTSTRGYIVLVAHTRRVFRSVSQLHVQDTGVSDDTGAVYMRYIQHRATFKGHTHSLSLAPATLRVILLHSTQLLRVVVWKMNTLTKCPLATKSSEITVRKRKRCAHFLVIGDNGNTVNTRPCRDLSLIHI